MSLATLVIVALALASPLGAQLGTVVPPKLSPRSMPVSNPSALEATELLDRAEPGVAPRVRFEWQPVSGATAYVLAGRWTDGHSWAVHAQEYRVTSRNATRWQAERVTFDISLPQGSHSWQVVAIVGHNDTGDFAHPTRLSFVLR